MLSSFEHGKSFITSGLDAGYYANSADPVQTLPNAVSDQGLHGFLTEISTKNACSKNENIPQTRNGLIQIIKIDKSTGQERIKNDGSTNVVTADANITNVVLKNC